MPANGNSRSKGKTRARIPSPEPSDEEIENACTDETHELTRKSFISTYLNLKCVENTVWVRIFEEMLMLAFLRHRIFPLWERYEKSFSIRQRGAHELRVSCVVNPSLAPVIIVP